MINLQHGDCLELMKEIPNGSIDMVLTDPPYGTTTCKWDVVIPFDLMWSQLKRIVKPSGAIVLFGSQPFTSELISSNISMFKYEWIWNKKRPSNPMLAKKQALKAHENILVFYSKQSTYNPQGVFETNGKSRGGVKPSKTELGYGRAIKKDYQQTKSGYPKSIIELGFSNRGLLHPTQKPVALLEYLIKTYTQENEVVLDFTMGSGSTGVACINTNRKFIGIEKDDKYFYAAKKRIDSKIGEGLCYG